MKSFAVLALFGALASAAPMNKRDVVWVTEYATDVVTVQATQTVWVDWNTQTKQAKVVHSNNRNKYSRTVGLTSTAVVTTSESSSAVPTTESTSSVYVAPATTSSSEYVAPTTTSVYVAPTTASTSSVSVAPTTSSVYVAPTTSSVYVAPTTSSVYVAPTTSSVAPTLPSTTAVYVAPTTSSAAPAATSAAAASGSTYSGDITYYDVGLGSCGWTNTASEAVVALAHGMMANGANPNNNPYCGAMITINYGGKQTQAKIVDTCAGCDGASIDLSTSLFATVAPSGDGRVHDVEWWFNN